jgi:hypothetical protein
LVSPNYRADLQAFAAREIEFFASEPISLNKKQQSENTLAIAKVSWSLNELVKYKPIVAKRRFHLFSAAHD